MSKQERDVARKNRQRQSSKIQVDNIIADTGCDPVVCTIEKPTAEEYRELWDALSPGDVVIFEHPQKKRLRRFFTSKKVKAKNRADMRVRLHDGRELYRKNIPKK